MNEFTEQLKQRRLDSTKLSFDELLPEKAIAVIDKHLAEVAVHHECLPDDERETNQVLYQYKIELQSALKAKTKA